MKKKLLTLVMVILVIGVGWYVARQYFTLDEIAAEETRLRAALAENPVTAFLVGLLVYVVLSFLPPTAGKSLVFGWLYGLWQGVLLVNVGLTIAAIGMFWVSRYLLREGLRSRFGVSLQRLDRAIDRDGASYLFALRMMHAPYTILNYAMGTTGIKTVAFWWATQLGMLPGNILFVYAGTQLPTLQEAADKGLTSIASWPLILAFVLIGVFPLAARWAVRRVRRRR
jgi:uncharacterized membrane protein YdjX (TVP38/TMEM64 family)